MSIDDPTGEPSGAHQPSFQNKHQRHQAGQELHKRDSTQNQDHLNQSKASNFNPDSSVLLQSIGQNESKEEEKKQEESTIEPLTVQSSQSSRRLSVQDRINLFENKQKENSGGKAVAAAKPAELRRLSSDVSCAPASERAVLRRWSGVSDMSIDLGNDKDNNSTDSPMVTPSSSSLTQSKSIVFSASLSDDKGQQGLSDTASSVKVEVRSVSGSIDQGEAGLKGKVNWKDQTDTQVQLKSFAGKSYQEVREEKYNKGGNLGGDETSSGVKDQEAGFEGKLAGNLDRGETVGPNNQARFQKNAAVSMKESMKVDLEIPKKKVPKPSAGLDQILKMQGGRDDIGCTYSNKKSAGPDQDSFGIVQASSVEQVQRVRQSKGNQELNDELKLKASELEKLFAEHKLRVPGDQSSSARRSKATESQVEQTISSQYKKPLAAESTPVAVEVVKNASDNATLTTPPPMKVDHQDFGRQSFPELSVSDDSRGKFYEKYMQKRDAKLRDEWGTKRAEKEAKLKAMQDNLEWSRAELKAKFSGSTDRLDTLSSADQRAEKLRLYHSRSSIKRGQNLADSFQSEEDEDPSEFSEHKYYRQDQPYSDASLTDGASRSSQSKKMFANRNTSTPRMAAAPVPRSSAKISNPISGRRRASENPLAQSVPNFSDFRKENTKPSSGISKTANRAQARPYTRSKSTNEEAPLVKEEKPRRSQSLRKSAASPAEFKDLPPLNSSDVVLAPLKFDKEQSEQGPYKIFSKNADPKPKGSASIVKQKTSMASDVLNNEEFEDSPFEAEDSLIVAKEQEDDDELDATEVEDYCNNENGKSTLSPESDKMSESENDDSLRSLSQVEPTSVVELPASIPPAFHGAGSLQDSPSESPVSWNSRLHNPFSYPHEISDIDACVESPIGSPASWNCQPEADRMRKKWGSAQRPFLVANPSHNQPRKDVTKGFKRLLKFGRKSRGSESLVDWISATTSDGDDDTEDGRDLANRSSEDLRKSRMGFSQSHVSDDGFNESELYNEQVQAIHSSIPAPPANFKLRDDHMSGSSIKAPRSSFFSLSSFRSKGSESKLR